jgi:hypothetical protein
MVSSDMPLSQRFFATRRAAGRVVPLDAAGNAGLPVPSSEPASGLQDALGARPYLLRRHETAPAGGRYAVLYRLGETRIVIEKAGNGLLGEFIDIAALVRRERGKTGFLLGREIDDDV